MGHLGRVRAVVMRGLGGKGDELVNQQTDITDALQQVEKALFGFGGQPLDAGRLGEVFVAACSTPYGIG